MQFNPDQSLQRAGANLGGVEEAADEMAAAYAAAEAKAANFTQTFGRMVDQMVNDMPASAVLKADMEATRQKANRATTADEWREVVGQAATLKKVYDREHEVDQARLAGGRGGRHRERRADVTTAERDN